MARELTQMIETMCLAAKRSSSLLAQITSEQKTEAILAMADQLILHYDQIIAINQQEVIAAKNNNLPLAQIDRLMLNKDRFMSIITGMKQIAQLADPVAKTLSTWQVESGLKISRISIPLGVVTIIYEARPNVTADASALCIKSGNAVILRGGSECVNTNKIITDCLQKGLLMTGLPINCIQYVPVQDRKAIDVLLKMEQYIDVIVPRGGKSLISHIREHSRIPIFSHLEGICHTYIHEQAQLDMAIKVLVNAKMRRPGICGATETLLIDAAIANQYLPNIIDALIEKGCEIRGDQASQKIDQRISPATEQDWSTEYLAPILSIKVVEDIHQAINHIATYGSNHTEAIITDNLEAAQLFQRNVNSAIVMHNCSTQFADGNEFGMGAEIGIATGKLHARGPVGVEQLTTFKYVVNGTGQIRK